MTPACAKNDDVGSVMMAVVESLFSKTTTENLKEEPSKIEWLVVAVFGWPLSQVGLYLITFNEVTMWLMFLARNFWIPLVALHCTATARALRNSRGRRTLCLFVIQ